MQHDTTIEIDSLSRTGGSQTFGGTWGKAQRRLRLCCLWCAVRQWLLTRWRWSHKQFHHPGCTMYTQNDSTSEYWLWVGKYTIIGCMFLSMQTCRNARTAMQRNSVNTASVTCLHERTPYFNKQSYSYFHTQHARELDFYWRHPTCSGSHSFRFWDGVWKHY